MCDVVELERYMLIASGFHFFMCAFKCLRSPSEAFFAVRWSSDVLPGAEA